jgi:hypothetical protein
MKGRSTDGLDRPFHIAPDPASAVGGKSFEPASKPATFEKFQGYFLIFFVTPLAPRFTWT